MSNAMLELNQIRKSFDGVEVLSGIDLRVMPGEFITILSSSGGGKTTLLRIIAGLDSCDSGTILLDGKDVTDLPPEKRNVNMVFQNYALFPHMNVGENIGYSLKLKHVPRLEREKTVADALALVQLPGYESRKPTELSGGQRQRVAIARALVNKPKILLLDEPLGALDLQLRRQMQIELKRLQKQLGITFIYITHDQEEALNMSDRIAVMKNGIFQQIGSPSEIYDHPKNAYVAFFVGSANILSGTALLEDGRCFLQYGGGRVEVDPAGRDLQTGDALTVAVRSEAMELLPAGEKGIPATVKEKSFSAGMLRIALQTETGDEMIASRHGIDYHVSPGDVLTLSFPKENAVIVEAEDEKP